MASQGFPIVCDLGTAVAANANATHYFTQPRAPKATPSKVYVVSAGAVTASDTDYMTLTVSMGGTTVGSVNTKTSASGGTGNLVAGDRVSVTISSAPYVAQGAACSLAKTFAGAGAVLAADSKLIIEMDEVRG